MATPSSGEPSPAALVESAKRAAAFEAVKNHFTPSMTHVGIGSGSTVAYVVEAIAAAMQEAGSNSCVFVPTGSQSRGLILAAGLTAIQYESIGEQQMLDVAFDGADECDADFNLVKGGGLCLFQEKLVAIKAKTFICVADFRKDSQQLLTTWPYIPIEVCPMASSYVIAALKALGSPDPQVRLMNTGTQSPGNVGPSPMKTDQNFWIVMAPFPPLLTSKDASAAGTEGKTTEGLTGKLWEVSQLASAIKSIPGVLDVGIFTGVNGPEAQAQEGQGGQKPIAAYFGMSDGTVKVRTADLKA
ncbi:hypothetical protein FH972_022375 [Carpinus fangiana]|uniref:Ribose-5-phosphate isomerase n=1 Tax=Carpinus fangiana TaxID=176857 RepID=A0A5N6KS34_9ROSI|nr:hypothetical protein FH972_022375 [Carpinus fangiana]